MTRLLSDGVHLNLGIGPLEVLQDQGPYELWNVLALTRAND